MNDSKIYIETENLSIGYRQARGVLPLGKNINLKFRAGEFVGVAGINGAGKSTLLRTLAGLLPPLEGEVKLLGEPITSMSLQKIASAVSIVLTEKIGGFNLTAYDAVAAGQMPYTDSFHHLLPHHRAEIRKAIITMRINGHEHKLLHELSDGLFQKTMIAKALAQQTPLMLLDEPSAFLDYASRHELFLLLRHLCAEENKCILVSAHDLDLVLKYCSRIIIFSDGNIESVAVEHARQHPSFVKMGGGFI